MRRAVIALEMRGLLESRQGSGVYVRRTSVVAPAPARDLDIGAFDQAEARRLFEGDSGRVGGHVDHGRGAGVSLESLVAEMNNEKATKEQSELADRQFHTTIARAEARNRAVVRVVENTWDMRYKSPLCMQMLERAREARRRPLNDEHQDIIESLRTRDPTAARTAMQAHSGGLGSKTCCSRAELQELEQTRGAASRQARGNCAAGVQREHLKPVAGEARRPPSIACLRRSPRRSCPARSVPPPRRSGISRSDCFRNVAVKPKCPIGLYPGSNAAGTGQLGIPVGWETLVMPLNVRGPVLA